jgi:hypothetical protein
MKAYIYSLILSILAFNSLAQTITSNNGITTVSKNATLDKNLTLTYTSTNTNGNLLLTLTFYLNNVDVTSPAMPSTSPGLWIGLEFLSSTLNTTQAGDNFIYCNVTYTTSTTTIPSWNCYDAYTTNANMSFALDSVN